jgi:hypothetical protein
MTRNSLAFLQGFFIVHLFALFFLMWCFMVLSSLLHGRDMYEILQPIAFLPLIIFKRNRKTEKKKKKALALVAWQRLQGGTE